ncbi:MAG: tRNA (N6-isopentenyl adenosine(37)-C2)-methylthiotransferase MiaB [Nitrospinae bacterium]|nr:tRNA (N6-isopentenyl adenosine(37)-C2)-methylthiotransferase MiaB [Nitrospinota bacterium]
MMSKNLAILTYGCQMNKYDSERIVGILKGLDFQLTDDLRSADMIMLNTCSIREKAEQKVFSQLGRLKRLKEDNPDLIIGVGGCIAQIKGDKIFQRAPQVDLIFGTLNIDHLSSMVREVEKKRGRVIGIAKDFDPDIQPPLTFRESQVSAWVNIIQGCDNYCTYCVVPYTRGRERSRSSSIILDEIRGLADQGYKEVTLLGQNVNSYGKDKSDGIDFPQLLYMIEEIDGIKRIRFVTSHPKDISERLMYAMRDMNKVCEHLHLPLQSGSNRILNKMGRGYTSEEYLSKIDRLKSFIPEIVISTDIIVGFPGETDDDFNKTEEILKEVEYDTIFLFKYSPRPETLAGSLSNHVPPNIKEERFNNLLMIQKEISLKKNKALEGTSDEVLVEGHSKKDPGKLTSRTRSNKIVNFYSNRDMKGEIIEVKIIRGGLYSLDGEIIERGC